MAPKATEGAAGDQRANLSILAQYVPTRDDALRSSALVAARLVAVAIGLTGSDK